ncbi:MAG: hypothetical protein K2K95_02490, partial [Muribaculaceae bacterium]|nr:hypothetical protein [Muribaculaceae bacterium]
LSMRADSLETPNLTVCKKTQYPPVHAGSMENVIRYHFKYPAEAWKAQKLMSLDAILLIDSEGKVRDVETEKPIHPALLAELKRVMQKTSWYPASIKDAPVNVKYHQLLEFMSDRIYRFPRGLDTYALNAEKIAKSWRKVSVLSEIRDSDLKTVEDAAGLVPEYLPIAFNLIGYLNASGQSDKAMSVADSCYKAYHSLYKSLDSISFVTNIRSARLGYNGRSEIATAMMRAMSHDISNSPNRDELFATVLDLIDARIIDGDLLENPSQRELRASEERVKQMRRSMVEELSGGHLSLSRSDELSKRVGRAGGYSLEQISSSLAYWSDKGMVDNAMIVQLTNLIKSEREKILSGKNINKKSINLFGVKALALLLYKGQQAMEEYMAQMIENTDNEKLKNYLTATRENFKRNEGLLTDKATMIKSLSCLVPEKCDDPETKQLLEYRKTIAAIFPVKWLFRL